MRDIVLIIHDIRSCHNVGSLLRTAEGLGVARVFITGYSPYPSMDNDSRLPHIHQKLTRQISKTALGAEHSQPWEHHPDVDQLLDKLSVDGYRICALEQSNTATRLPEYVPTGNKIALLLGREVEGIDPELLQKADVTLEIPMFGSKESFNVVQAAAMALYHLRFH